MPPASAKTFEPRGNVHSIAHEIVAIYDDVTEVDADAKPHMVRLRHIGVPLVDLQLDFGSAPHRLNRAGELRN